MMPIQGIAFSIACSVAVGINVVFTKLAVELLNATACMVIMMSMAAFLSLAHFRRRSLKRLCAQSIKYTAIHVLLALGGVVFTWLGIEKLNPTTAAFIGRLEVVFSIVMAIVLLGEALNWRRFFGFFLGVCGVVIMSWPTSNFDGWFRPGIAYILLAAVCWGGCEVFGKRAIETIPVSNFMIFRNVLMAAILWIYVVASGTQINPTSEAMFYIAGAAFFGPYLARHLFMLSVTYLPVSISVGLNQTQPIFTGIFSLLAGLTLPATSVWLGGFLIVAGCLCLLEMRPSAQSKMTFSKYMRRQSN